MPKWCRMRPVSAADPTFRGSKLYGVVVDSQKLVFQQQTRRSGGQNLRVTGDGRPRGALMFQQQTRRSGGQNAQAAARPVMGAFQQQTRRSGGQNQEPRDRGPLRQGFSSRPDVQGVKT
jgi:hypothetical protein